MPCAKITYSTKQFADYDIKRIAKISKRSKVPVRSYQCKQCGQWHLTSTEKQGDTFFQDLIQHIHILLEENRALRESAHRYEKLTKAERKEVAVDERVAMLQIALEKTGVRNSALNKTNRELITKIVKLEKSIEVLQEKH